MKNSFPNKKPTNQPATKTNIAVCSEEKDNSQNSPPAVACPDWIGGCHLKAWNSKGSCLLWCRPFWEGPVPWLLDIQPQPPSPLILSNNSRLARNVDTNHGRRFGSCRQDGYVEDPPRTVSDFTQSLILSMHKTSLDYPSPLIAGPYLEFRWPSWLLPCLHSVFAILLTRSDSWLFSALMLIRMGAEIANDATNNLIAQLGVRGLLLNQIAAPQQPAGKTGRKRVRQGNRGEGGRLVCIWFTELTRAYSNRCRRSKSSWLKIARRSKLKRNNW